MAIAAEGEGRRAFLKSVVHPGTEAKNSDTGSGSLTTPAPEVAPSPASDRKDGGEPPPPGGGGGRGGRITRRSLLGLGVATAADYGVEKVTKWEGPLTKLGLIRRKKTGQETKLEEPKAAAPAAPAQVEAPKVEAAVKSKSAEALLGSSAFGFSDEQMAKIKAEYGDDLDKYRRTIVTGNDPKKLENVTTVFDFSERIDEEGYREMIEDVNSLVNTKLTMDPFRDGSKLPATLLQRPVSEDKIVVRGDQSFPMPSGKGWTESSLPGQTNGLRPHSIVRNKPGNNVSADIAEAMIRQLTYSVQGASLGPTISKYPGPWIPIAAFESGNNAVASAVENIVNRGMSEEAAKAEVVARAGEYYPNFGKDPIYRADISSISLERFGDANNIWKK